MKGGTLVKTVICEFIRRPAPWRILVAVAMAILALSLSLAAYAGTATVDISSLKSSGVVAPTGPSKSTGSNLQADKGDPGFLGQLIVYLKPGTDPVAFGNANGLTYLDTLKSDKDAHVYLAGSKSATTSAMTTLAASPSVRKVFENRRSQNVREAFVPNDPYFHSNTPVAGWPGQWHLSNEWTPGLDVDIMPAWAKDMTGYGVIMAVVDDCLQKSHPDLAPNYDAADSWDFGQGDADPSPVYSDDQHGVSTSGVAAARGGNGVGVTGAAPLAKIAGLRIDFPLQTDAMFVDATQYHSSGGNTNIKVKNHSYGISTPYIANDAQTVALETSTAAGTIHCFAAGNDRFAGPYPPYPLGEDSNKKQTQADPDSITVAAMGSDGKYASYSCFGANVFCTAPSSSAGLFGITTTDRTGTLGYNSGAGDTFPNNYYTSIFGGTSSATPLVAGILALAKQVQPNLDTRLAKHLLAFTSREVDLADASFSSDGGWKINGAGYHFNENYGFGLIDADALCYYARAYSGVTPFAGVSTNTFTLPANTTIPDNDPTGVTVNINVGGTTGPAETMTLNLGITHSYRGDLEAIVTSPSGMTSRMMCREIGDNAANISWTFSSNAFWGESADGIWQVKVVDNFAGDVGTWDTMNWTLYTGQVVADTAAPNVTIDQMATQPDPTQGSAIYFTVHFDKWVTDFTASDIVLGGTAGATTAAITAGAGRNYTVKVTGMTLHGTVTASIPAGAAHNVWGTDSLASTSTDNTVTWNTKPRNLYISPNSGVLTAGVWKTLSSAYDDYNGASDILKAYLVINHSLTYTNAAYMKYDASTNKVYLQNDANSSWGTGYTPGSAVTLANSQVYLDIKNTSIAMSGKNLVVKWRIKTKGTFPSSTLYGYQLVTDTGLLSSPWQLMGTF